MKKLIEVKNDKETNSNNIEWVEITSDNENLDEKDDQEDNEEIEENIDEQRDPNIDLKCFECLLVFETKEDRKEHQESTGHCMEPNHNCSICVRHLGTKKKYSSSWWEKERKNKSLCTLCGSSVLTIHLKRHMKCHEKKHYECEYCNEGMLLLNNTETFFLSVLTMIVLLLLDKLQSYFQQNLINILILGMTTKLRKLSQNT